MRLFRDAAGGDDDVYRQDLRQLLIPPSPPCLLNTAMPLYQVTGSGPTSSTRKTNFAVTGERTLFRGKLPDQAPRRVWQSGHSNGEIPAALPFAQIPPLTGAGGTKLKSCTALPTFKYGGDQ